MPFLKQPVVEFAIRQTKVLSQSCQSPLFKLPYRKLIVHGTCRSPLQQQCMAYQLQLALKLAHLQDFSGWKQWLWQLEQARWSTSAFLCRNELYRVALTLRALQLCKSERVYIYSIWNAFWNKLIGRPPKKSELYLSTTGFDNKISCII